jgi:hypothetical protein
VIRDSRKLQKQPLRSHSFTLEGFTYYGGYTPRGENYPYYWDAGYVPEPHYVRGPCQPGTIFFGEDGERHLCE